MEDVINAEVAILSLILQTVIIVKPVVEARGEFLYHHPVVIIVEVTIFVLHINGAIDVHTFVHAPPYTDHNSAVEILYSVG